MLSDPEARRAYDGSLAGDVARAGAAPPRSRRRSRVARSADPARRASRTCEDDVAEFDGARLRRARLRRGIELDEIARITKINPTYLALPRGGALRELPARVYVRGFVVAYARCLGLDPRARRRQLHERASRRARPEPAPRRGSRRRGDAGASSWARPRRASASTRRSRRSPASRAPRRGAGSTRAACASTDARRAPSQRVRDGDALEAEPPEPVPSPLAPEPIALRVLYEDADLIVVDKPAGLVVHPAPGHASGTLVNALLHHCARSRRHRRRAAAGHRAPARPRHLGRARRREARRAHLALAAQFHDHSDRARLPRARARRAGRRGRAAWSAPIGRHPRDRKRMSVHAHAGREAATAWRVRRALPAQRARAARGAARRRAAPTRSACTSRASGLPIAGDPVYGRAARAVPSSARPALHAAVLGFDSPAQRRSGCASRRRCPPTSRALLARSASARRRA